MINYVSLSVSHVFNHVFNLTLGPTHVKVTSENILLKGIEFISTDLSYLYLGPMIEFLHTPI